MIYSIISEDAIFKSKAGESQQFSCGGDIVQTEMKNNIRVISRVYSTNPRSYLNPMLQPGMPFNERQDIK